jgi:chromosome segregation ATPase
MMSDLLPILIPTLVTSLGALVVAVLSYRSARGDTTRQERADVITAYESLCENLREMIRVNNEEIARLRANIEALQRQVDVERETWAREREALVERIAELEAINARLERQLNQLRAETRGRE